MKLHIELAATVPKDIEQPSLNEDAWATSSLNERLALSDGASESYDSRTWARLLVERYVGDLKVDQQWVDGAVAHYRSKVDYDSLSWSQQAAFDRGSFATLLGLELAPNGHDLELLSIGDCLAVHVRDHHVVATYPYSEAAEFDQRPSLLATIPVANAFLGESGFYTRHSAHTWQIQNGDLIYLCTDAVGQWLLLEVASAINSISILASVNTDQDFSELIGQLRQQRRIRLDDSTLIRLRVEEQHDNDLPNH